MDYSDKTREDLIEIIEKYRKKFEDIKINIDNTRIRLEAMNHPDPEPVVSRSGIPRYTCECGVEINITRKKRHEASAKHIRRVVQIRE